MRSLPLSITGGVAVRSESFLVTDLDNTLIDSRERFRRSINEAIGAPLASTPADMNLKNLTREQRNKFYETFLSAKYMNLDIPVKGSVEVLGKLHSMGLGLVYLTGRHHSRESSLKTETLETLSRYRYPVPNGLDVMLYMKPGKMSSTNEFKRRVLCRLATTLSLMIGVDDEPDDLRVMVEFIPLTIGMALSSEVAREILSKVRVPLARDWHGVESIIKKEQVVWAP